jgi:hypothetical protein
MRIFGFGFATTMKIRITTVDGQLDYANKFGHPPTRRVAALRVRIPYTPVEIPRLALYALRKSFPAVFN